MTAQALAGFARSIDLKIKALEVSFAPALTGAVPIGFFNAKITQVTPIIADCMGAKNIASNPNPGALVKRSQFQYVQDKLEGFQQDDFPYMEQQLVTFITSPEAATKATALANIGLRIPPMLKDYIQMKYEMKQVKDALKV